MNEVKIKKSKNNIGYLDQILNKNSETETFCVLQQTGPSLKIGRRYIKKKTEQEIRNKANQELEKQINNINANPHERSLESIFPKSQLTLGRAELDSLIKFLKENYEPFKQGAQKYITIQEDGFNDNFANKLLEISQSQEKEKLFKCILDNDLIEEDLLQSVEIKKKKLDIDIFEKRLANPNLLEDKGPDNWQDWFSKNKWFFGSDYVKILKRRTIDENSKTDFLASSYGNFLDIVEIKKPSLDDGKLFKEDIIEKEGAEWKYYHPTVDLIKAISQCYRYINEIEKKVGDPDSGKKFEECEIVKPRCTLIFGRSNNFTKDEYKALRILNSHYNNFSIVTYDQLLERAKKMVEIIQNKKQND